MTKEKHDKIIYSTKNMQAEKIDSMQNIKYEVQEEDTDPET